MTDDEAVPAPRRPRWRRRFAALGLVLLATSRWWALPILRGMDFFRVRHVEVRGARFTPAREILARVKVDSTYSVWGDLGPLAARVRAHPAVSDVRVRRRFPSTLVITIEEFQPVALVPVSGGMRAYDASGRALPLDPSRTPVDLPVVSRADSTLFRLLADIRVAEPALFARISEARRGATRDEVVLQLVTLPVRLRPDVAMDRLAQVFSVEQDLLQRHVRASELDLRFKDQVIARIQ